MTGALVWMGLSIGSAPAWSCTTFLLDQEGPVLVAKSYDWHHEDGILHRNPAGLRKKGLVLSPEERPHEWVSRHSSLTFNQYGREMPNGGMNDAGLVVEIMWLEQAEWPGVDSRTVFNELQWIQYQLDMHGTTQEVVDSADTIRVAPIHGRVHYMVCDRTGDCASLEYLEGKLVVHDGDRLEVPVLTNHTYAQSVSHLRAQDGVAGTGSGSLSRFSRAAAYTTRDASVETAWEGLESVRWKRTQWQIVYEPEDLTVHFRTRSHSPIRTIRLPDLVARCGSAVPTLSMQAPLTGDVTAGFESYDSDKNRTLVQTGVQTLQLDLPRPVLEAVAVFSEHFYCDI